MPLARISHQISTADAHRRALADRGTHARAAWGAALLAGSIACGPGGESSLQAGGKEPGESLDVVVITLDTTRADALGAYGQRLPITPRIDAMVADGLLFEQVAASSPTTVPSHATLFTGKQPYAHGVRSNSGYRLSRGNVTLAEVLNARGYRTGAEIGAAVLARPQQLDQGFELYRLPHSVGSVLEAVEASHERAQPRLTRDAEEITRRGLAFLRENEDRPFLLWLHYFDPHRPYAPPEPFRTTLYDAYFAEIRRVDHHVGRVLDEIERLGLRERTLVVLTADHGEGRGEHGEDSHAFFVYQSTIRVPLVFWGAEMIPRGRRVGSLVRLADVTPTILDLLGLPPLEDAQGISLRPLFEDSEADLSLTAYGESIDPLVIFGSDVLRFVRVGRWKYIHKLEPELFDLDADPDETSNLAAEHPQVLARLRHELERLLAAAPPAPSDAEAEPDPEQLARLQALGYAAGAPQAPRDELATLELSGPDPVSWTEDLWVIDKALGDLVYGNAAEAEPRFRELWERTPRSPRILAWLIEALLALDRVDEAIPLLRRAIELEPKRVQHRLTLSRKLVEEERPDEAERVLRRLLVIEACSVEARLRLSELLRASGRYAEQVDLLEAGLHACPGSIVLRNALAYALATSADPKLRDGPRAVRLAERTVAETGGERPDYLDTLAAAYAEVGEFERAVAEQRRALAILEGRDLPPEILESFHHHLAAFEAREPLRER